MFDFSGVQVRATNDPLPVLWSTQILSNRIVYCYCLFHNRIITSLMLMSTAKILTVLILDKYHMKIYIHGANATPISWNYISEHVGDGIRLSYNSANSFKDNLDNMIAKLDGIKEFEFIGHSLGGIYALHLANYFKYKANINGAVTLSTPFGGVNIPYITRYMFAWHQLIKDIVPIAWPIKTLDSYMLPCRWCNIVTTSGHAPWILEPNDGVVSINSQKHRKDMELIEINCNHYEIVLNQNAVDIIKSNLS